MNSRNRKLAALFAVTAIAGGCKPVPGSAFGFVSDPVGVGQGASREVSAFPPARSKAVSVRVVQSDGGVPVAGSVFRVYVLDGARVHSTGVREVSPDGALSVLIPIVGATGKKVVVVCLEATVDDPVSGVCVARMDDDEPVDCRLRARGSDRTLSGWSDDDLQVLLDRLTMSVFRGWLDRALLECSLRGGESLLELLSRRAEHWTNLGFGSLVAHRRLAYGRDPVRVELVSGPGGAGVLTIGGAHGYRLGMRIVNVDPAGIVLPLPDIAKDGPGASLAVEVLEGPARVVMRAGLSVVPNLRSVPHQGSVAGIADLSEYVEFDRPGKYRLRLALYPGSACSAGLSSGRVSPGWLCVFSEPFDVVVR